MRSCFSWEFTSNLTDLGVETNAGQYSATIADQIDLDLNSYASNRNIQRSDIQNIAEWNSGNGGAATDNSTSVHNWDWISTAHTTKAG